MGYWAQTFSSLMAQILGFFTTKFTIFEFQFSLMEIFLCLEFFDIVFMFISRSLGKNEVEIDVEL